MFTQFISDAWFSFDAYGKLVFIITMLWNMPVFFIWMPLVEKFSTKKDDVPNSRVTLVCPNVYQCAYWRGHSNTTFIVGKDNTVLVHLPPPPQSATVAAVRALGDVKVIIATQSHDSYAKQWAQMFPDALVLSTESDSMPWLGVPIAGALRDNMKLLANYYITDVLETKGFSRFNDATFVLEIVGKRCVIMCCGIGNFTTNLLNPISIHKYGCAACVCVCVCACRV
jgi:hypothetical protein